MGQRVIESMWRWEVPGKGGNEYGTLLVVRVWRQEEKIQEEYDQSDLDICAKSLGYTYKTTPSKRTILQAFEKIPRVNAVEVLDLRGNGALVYPDWP